MSCMISRRNFMRCVGISALAVASSSLLGGCNQFGAEYGVGETAQWKDETGKTVFMLKLATAEVLSPEDVRVKQYQLDVEKGQLYAFLHFEVENDTGDLVDLYEKRSGFFPFIKTEYTDEDIREHFFEREEMEEGQTDEYAGWPNANQMADAPSVIWAYQNGSEMNKDRRLFGVICYDTANPNDEEHTYAKIPTGKSNIDCIGQISDDCKIMRLVYRMLGTEINFVYYPAL